MNIITIDDFVSTMRVSSYTAVYISYKCTLFHASITVDGTRQIWGLDGNTLIAWTDEPDITMEQLREMLNGSIEGKKYCLDCHKEIMTPPHCMFAGRYCDDCWTDKMEREADWVYAHLD